MKYVIFVLLLSGCTTFPPCKDVPKKEKQQCLKKHYERMERLERMQERGFRGDR